jgi:hypothetical protein
MCPACLATAGMISAGPASTGVVPAVTMKAKDLITNESKKLAALAIFLRIYGVLTLIIFGSLFVGFAVQTPLLADEPKGALNWVIWNGTRCGSEPCHVPPMLFIRLRKGLRQTPPQSETRSAHRDLRCLSPPPDGKRPFHGRVA